MSELDGFSVFDFDVGVASASITPNGITFNKSVATKLGFPEFVVLLINAETKQVAIKCCDGSALHATSFYRERKPNESARSVRWSSRDLLNTLCEMMDWDLRIMAHRVEGRLLSEEGAMIFDLTKATDMK